MERCPIFGVFVFQIYQTHLWMGIKTTGLRRMPRKMFCIHWTQISSKLKQSHLNSTNSADSSFEYRFPSPLFVHLTAIPFRMMMSSVTRFQLRYTTWFADLETGAELFIPSDFVSSRSRKLDTCYRHPEKLAKWSFFERKLKIEIFMIGWMKSWKGRQKSKWQERLQAHVLPFLMITNVLSRFMAFEAPLSMLFRGFGRRSSSPTREAPRNG